MIVTTLPKPHVQLSVIWGDEEFFELVVTVSNGRFAGYTAVYETSELLLGLAGQLPGLPTQIQDLLYEAGDRATDIYCALRFYCIDNAGRIGLEVTLKHPEPDYPRLADDIVTLHLQVVPSAIDRFQKELQQLALTRTGNATLFCGADAVW